MPEEIKHTYYFHTAAIFSTEALTEAELQEKIQNTPDVYRVLREKDGKCVFQRDKRIEINPASKVVIILLSLFLCLSAKAQFQSGVAFSGTTNTTMANAGTVQTNSITLNTPAKPFTLSNVSNTNEISVFGYGFNIVSSWGTTNFIPFQQWTNAFNLANGGTNNGTWTTNLPAGSYTIQLVPFQQVSIGSTNNNNVLWP